MTSDWPSIVWKLGGSVAGLGFVITIPALRASHHAVGVRLIEPMAMPAYPSDLARWIADSQNEVRHALGDHRAGADERIPSDRDSAHDGRIGADGTPALQPSSLIQRVPINLGARIRNIRQDA